MFMYIAMFLGLSSYKDGSLTQKETNLQYQYVNLQQSATSEFTQLYNPPAYQQLLLRLGPDLLSQLLRAH